MLTWHIRESLQVTPGPFPDFWVGPGDEARSRLGARLWAILHFFRLSSRMLQEFVKGSWPEIQVNYISPL